MQDKSIHFDSIDLQNWLRSVSKMNLEQRALDVFRYQYDHNPVYNRFCIELSIDPRSVDSVHKIPFLPIEFFKTQVVKTGTWEEETTFTSSGTTGQTYSKHHIRSLQDYHKVSLEIFSMFFGAVDQYVLLALLPSYLEREGSSLIDMVQMLINETGSANSGFFLDQYDEILSKIRMAKEADKIPVLWGVSFALLDFAEQLKDEIGHVVLVETGGMKGRRKELLREELHEILQNRTGVSYIKSEYGMTELMSQAYAIEKGIFDTPPWMKVLCREINDPLTVNSGNSSGGINIIDLANVHSCSFIATDDLGKCYANGTFEITGRLDNSDIRGCNLMIN